MNHPAPTWTPSLPPAPRSIKKGVPLKHVLGDQAVEYLGRNLQSVYPALDLRGFVAAALNGLEPLGILDRGHHVAQTLWQYLPQRFSSAAQVLLDSMTPPMDASSELGLAVFFYLPHVSFVAKYGLDPAYNGGEDPFEAAMHAQHELTQRFSAEFSIRPFLIEQPERTLARLQKWTTDPSAHVRRLCSEGTRPRLPWAMRLPAFIKDPTPVMPLLEALKDDPELYVRRSVANHLGDIAKDHPDWVYAVCERWLHNASSERKWLIRHALRHPAKKGDQAALSLRNRSK